MLWGVPRRFSGALDSHPHISSEVKCPTVQGIFVLGLDWNAGCDRIAAAIALPQTLVDGSPFHNATDCLSCVQRDSGHSCALRADPYRGWCEFSGVRGAGWPNPEEERRPPDAGGGAGLYWLSRVKKMTRSSRRCMKTSMTLPAATGDF